MSRFSRGTGILPISAIYLSFEMARWMALRPIKSRGTPISFLFIWFDACVIGSDKIIRGKFFKLCFTVEHPHFTVECLIYFSCRVFEEVLLTLKLNENNQTTVKDHPQHLQYCSGCLWKRIKCYSERFERSWFLRLGMQIRSMNPMFDVILKMLRQL